MQQLDLGGFDQGKQLFDGRSGSGHGFRLFSFSDRNDGRLVLLGACYWERATGSDFAT